MKIRLSILFMFLYLPLQSQIINNNLLITFNFMFSNPLGTTDQILNNARFPKFFSNMETSVGGDITGIYLLHGNLGAGLSVGANYSTGWKYGYLEYYKDATAFILFTSPLIYYQTPPILKEKLRLFVNAGPVFANTSIELADQVIYIDDNSGKPITKILSTSNSGTGFNLSGGLRFYLNSKTAFTVNCSYRYITTGSVLYEDEEISSLSYGIGVTIMFMKDKKYYF
jgi:hypothetical protein